MTAYFGVASQYLKASPGDISTVADSGYVLLLDRPQDIQPESLRNTDLMCYGGGYGTNSECSSYLDSCDSGDGICTYRYIHFNNAVTSGDCGTGQNNSSSCECIMDTNDEQWCEDAELDCFGNCVATDCNGDCEANCDIVCDCPVAGESVCSDAFPYYIN